MRLLDSPCILDPKEAAKEAHTVLTFRGYGIRIRTLREQVENGLLA
jgi:hypothetical protein